MELFFLNESLCIIGTSSRITEGSFTKRYYSAGNFEFFATDGASLPDNYKFIYEPVSSFLGVITGKEYSSEDGLIIKGESAEGLFNRRILLRQGGARENLADALRLAVSEAGFSSVISFGDMSAGDFDADVTYEIMPLGDWLWKTLREFGMSWKLTLNQETEKLDFSVFGGVDRTSKNFPDYKMVLYEDDGDISNVKYSYDSSDSANCMYAIGGDGISEVYCDGDYYGFERKEKFVSAGDMKVTHFESEEDYRAQLRSRAKEKLKLYAVREYFYGKCAVGQEGEDYSLGDLCRFNSASAGVTLSARITEITRVFKGNTSHTVAFLGGQKAVSFGTNQTRKG